MQRPFYIIGHNPNTIEEATEYLNQGANALEPDIHWDPEYSRFRVSHFDPSETDLFLDDYLTGLKDVLRSSSKPHELALIAFDLKPNYDYSLPHLYHIVRESFSSAYPEVVITTTVASAENMNFLLTMKGDQRPNEAVGVDESVDAETVVATFAETGMNYTYAKGISFFEFEPLDSWIGPKSFVDAVQAGTKLRDAGPNGLGLIYGWCINSKSDMKAYLAMEPPVDGLLTDHPKILYKLLHQPEYSERYALAKPGYNPFAKSRIPN